MKLVKRLVFWAMFLVFWLAGTGQIEAQEFCPGYLANSGDPRVNTALGCIPVKAEDFMVWLLPYVFGIAGGIAFLLMIFGFIKMSTAKGDPKEVQGARETISSALMGLLVSIFALFILRLVAVDILHIPGIN